MKIFLLSVQFYFLEGQVLRENSCSESGFKYLKKKKYNLLSVSSLNIS